MTSEPESTIQYQKADTVVTNPEMLYNKVWKLLIDAIRREADKPGSSSNKVAKRLKVQPSTVKRWLDGDRGSRVSLKQTLNIAHTLGIPMESVLKELTPDNTAQIVQILQDDPEFMACIMDIWSRGKSSDIDKLKSEASYIQEKLD